MDPFLDADEQADALSPQQRVAFAVVRARLDRLADFRPVCEEQAQAKEFFKVVEPMPHCHTEERFLFWLNNRDAICRRALLRLQPGMYPEDTMILVKPSTGLKKPFSTVLEANACMDQLQALFGTTRRHLLEPETAPLIPAELMQRNLLPAMLLIARLRSLLGLGSENNN
jgi:hypothetical protein